MLSIQPLQHKKSQQLADFFYDHSSLKIRFLAPKNLRYTNPSYPQVF